MYYIRIWSYYMLNGFAAEHSGILTFDSLLGHWEQSEAKYFLRKAFGLMLNTSSKSEEPEYAQMVLETLGIILFEMNLGLESVLCCILKNVADGGKLATDAIENEFGKPVSCLIDGIHKLEKLDTSKFLTNKENLIGLLITLNDDIRVLLIRLAMRLYDIRHVTDYPTEKQKLIIGETRMLYLPIAHRLGLYRIKNELEDRLMRYIYPKTYKQIEEKLRQTKSNRDQYTSHFVIPIAEKLTENGFDFEIKSRVKSIPSIYRKMIIQKVDFESVYDIFAIRIIINKTIENEAADCWKAYSLTTDIYAPDPGRLRDWISLPKPNGYESLHTTVIGPGGRWVEVQIRSRRMDDIDEEGYAAHWKYKNTGKEISKEDIFSIYRELLVKPLQVSLDKIISQGKQELNSDDVFIFTPKGDLKKLKKGCTVLDFAYAVSSELGSTCTGAIINGKIVSLKYVLINGDTVKIVSSKTQKPHKDWLEIAKSPLSIFMIREALKIDVNHEKEKPSPRMPESAKSFPESISRIKAGKENYVIIDSGINSLHYQFASCCEPELGHTIFAFVSVTQGIKIHRTSCSNARQLIARFPYRVLEARWK
ncbi:MAG: HD domain-containing protein [Bacteroidetes bacterium]|nr:HD domain-containing protein [Bacteroidota bacterium]